MTLDIGRWSLSCDVSHDVHTDPPTSIKPEVYHIPFASVREWKLIVPMLCQNVPRDDRVWYGIKTASVLDDEVNPSLVAKSLVCVH